MWGGVKSNCSGWWDWQDWARWRYNVLWSSFVIYSGRKGNMLELLKEWDLLFKVKLPEQGDTLSNFQNFPNYSSSESCIIYRNCVSHCEVIVKGKVSLQTPWPLRKLSWHYQHDICKYWGVIYTHQGKYFSCFYSTWLSKEKRWICMIRVSCALIYWLYIVTLLGSIQRQCSVV